MAISTHLPPPVMIESAAALALVTHMLCWSWAMCFSAAASSENDHGSMNLASNTAPLPATMPSRVAPIHRSTGCRSRCWTHSMVCPVLRSYQSRLRFSVASPSWTMRLPERSSGSASPRFSRQSRSEGGLVVAHDDPGIRAADEAPAVGRFEPQAHASLPAMSSAASWMAPVRSDARSARIPSASRRSRLPGTFCAVSSRITAT